MREKNCYFFIQGHFYFSKLFSSKTKVTLNIFFKFCQTNLIICHNNGISIIFLLKYRKNVCLHTCLISCTRWPRGSDLRDERGCFRTRVSVDRYRFHFRSRASEWGLSEGPTRCRRRRTRPTISD